MTWFISGILLLNVLATLVVWRTALYERSQRVFQTVIVWILPVVGALVALIAWWSARENPSRHHIPRAASDDLSETFRQRSAADGD